MLVCIAVVTKTLVKSICLGDNCTTAGTMIIMLITQVANFA